MNPPCKRINDKPVKWDLAFKLMNKFGYCLYNADDNCFLKMVDGKLYIFEDNYTEWLGLCKAKYEIMHILKSQVWNMAYEKQRITRGYNKATLLTGEKARKAFYEGSVLKERTTSLLIKNNRGQFQKWNPDVKQWVNHGALYFDLNYYLVVEDPQTELVFEDGRKEIDRRSNAALHGRPNPTPLDESLKRVQVAKASFDKEVKEYIVYNQNRKLTLEDFNKVWVYRNKSEAYFGKIVVLSLLEKTKIYLSGYCFSEKEFFSQCHLAEQKDIDILFAKERV